MTKIATEYMGDLHCATTHLPSGAIIGTDAPIEYGGKGQSFNPYDLLGVALASSMATAAGFYAQKNKIDLKGLIIEVNNIFGTDAERRVTRMEVQVKMPLSLPENDRNAIENGMKTCPVILSLNSNIEIPINFHW